MEIQQLNAKTWIVRGPVNMGLVSAGDGLVAIDTGLDKQSGKNLLKATKEIGMPLRAIINTHAHADHYGGNAYILSQTTVPVYAPRDEAGIIRRPQFEPEYLWHGAKPFAYLMNKFLLASASPVDIELTGEMFHILDTPFAPFHLPGHAHGQMGIFVHDVMFAADAYFDTDVIDKHGLPFLVDLEAAKLSANELLTQAVTWYVPGHGAPSSNPALHIEYLFRRHDTAIEMLLSFVQAPASLPAIVEHLCDKFTLNLTTPGAYMLVQTTVAAYLSSCIDRGIVDVRVEQGTMRFVAT